MRLLPVGIDSQAINCVFVHVDGVGFWFMSTKSKLYGEAKILEEHKKSLQRFELNSTWLITEIVDNHFDALSQEILTSNPTKLSDDELKALSTDKEALQLEVEIHTRNLTKEFKLFHPVIKHYRERIGNLLIDNKILDYQNIMAFAALKVRCIADTSAVIVDAIDPHKGNLDAIKFKSGEIKVGIPDLHESDLNSPMISSDLTQQIYYFANLEHNGMEWQTDKMIQDTKPEEVNPDANAPEDDTEKKDAES